MVDRVAIQGEAGSFSHAAAIETYGSSIRLVPCATFVDLFRSVETGAATSGVVPIENTLAGSVHENYDLLSAHALHVVAAIASRLAASLYGATVLQDGLEDNSENYTRFLMVTREPLALARGQTGKTSLMFTLGSGPGTLHKALGVFAERGLNLTKIESRPLPGRPWEYLFYADVVDTPISRIDEALEALRALAFGVRVLGTYPTRQESL
jgi:prephenate dehydratase